MNDCYNALLHPKRRENLKFILSDAFTEDDGKPMEWEMRQLTAAEGIELTGRNSDETKTLISMVARSLVRPSLCDAAFLKALSEKHGRTFLDPADALTAIVTDSELAALIRLYGQHNAVEPSPAAARG